MKIKSIIAVLICSLLSFSLTAPSIACGPPDCGDCYTWNSETEECEWDCSSGQTCCNGTCCDSDDCCNDEICCTGQKCCTDLGSYCCDSNQICCDGTCCDQGWRCCYGGYCCEGDKWCCMGSCCEPDLCEECVGGQCKVCGGDPTQCCDNGTCINKCDPDGGATCTWTSPPVQDPLCRWMHETDHSCLIPGATCDWEPTSGPGKNAACASCDPGCALGSTYCVMLKPVVCKTTLTIWPPFIDCTCTGTPALYDPVPRGTRYICP